MKNLLRLIVVALLFNSGGLYAANWTGWLKIYDCRLQGQLDTCGGCALFAAAQVRFAVDKGSQWVFKQYREDGNPRPPSRLENCAVADKENWSCRSINSYPHLVQDSSSAMAGGVFREVFTEVPKRGYESKSCAK
jgi:hypothetical protein